MHPAESLSASSGADQPAADRPGVEQPPARQPAAAEPPAGQPATDRPPADPAVAGGHEAEPAAVEPPAAGRPGSDPAAAGQPAADPPPADPAVAGRHEAGPSPADPPAVEPAEAAGPEAGPPIAGQPAADQDAAGRSADAGTAPAGQPRGGRPQADCAALLKQRFPALFAGSPKPVKLRIQADLQQRAPGEFGKQALSAFLRRHTGSTGYLIAMTRSPHRYDLDGKPAGEVSAEHRQAAADELARRRALHQAKIEQAEEGRRMRAGLLRDYERTTLTPANFCALRGIAPEALDALLQTARDEARQAPPPPVPPHHAQRRPEGTGRGAGRGDGRRRDERAPGGESGAPPARNDGRRRPRPG